MHAEYGIDGTPVVALLECSINGVDIEVDLLPGSRLAELHGGVGRVTEHTTCNYGLNTAMNDLAEAHGLRVSGTDDFAEIRAVERPDHPYFIATLYQPQLQSSAADPHPIFVGLVDAAALRAAT